MHQFKNIYLVSRDDASELEECIAKLDARVSQVFVCDFAIKGIETHKPIPGLSTGFVNPSKGPGLPSIYNLDHHAPDSRSEKLVSSGNLAMEWIAGHGVPHPGRAAIIINHTDCDSIISAAILAGLVDTQAHGPALEAAVIAADHTAEALPLSEMLQALDHERDMEFSIQSMNALLEGHVLDERARSLVDKRELARKEFGSLYKSRGKLDGTLAILALEEPAPHLDNSFFVALAPKAALCMLTYPVSAGIDSPRVVKLRLGSKPRKGIKLNSLPFDPEFGGRWNAGTNLRGGGTGLGLDEYVLRLKSWMETVGS